MTVTLFLRILSDERAQWERKGWAFVCDLWALGGWEQCLMKKDVTA